MADVTHPVAAPTPIPRQGEVFTDPRDEGRAMRVSWHRESQTVVVSLWRGEVCIGTHRLAGPDVARLVLALVGAADPSPERPVTPRCRA